MNSISGYDRSLPSGHRRIVVLLITLPVLWACNARSLTAPQPHPVEVGTQTFQQTLNREIDILFMIDDSPSMLQLQTKLLANFPVCMNVLKSLPMGVPDGHIAVVSQDTGAGICDLQSGLLRAVRVRRHGARLSVIQEMRRSGAQVLAMRSGSTQARSALSVA